MHVAGHVDLEDRQSAERRDELVLLAHRLPEKIDLDVAGLLGDVGRGGVAPLVGVKGPEQAHRERPRGAEAGARGDVGDADQLDARRHRVTGSGRGG